MDAWIAVLFWASALAPATLMAVLAVVFLAGRQEAMACWRTLARLSPLGLLALLPAWWMQVVADVAVPQPPGLASGPLPVWLALLVQLLGSVIGAFCARYLQGEPHRPSQVAAYAGVLAMVQGLLLVDHWLLLILAWAGVGAALRPLLCFYPERPFALLAAHKKRLADRAADLLLVAAALLASQAAGGGSFEALWQTLARDGASLPLQAAAVLLVAAVILRTALFPVHGWLVQVMEAPTPVSALLHAGVVNLGGFVLIRFAPLLEAVPPARALVVAFGLTTAVLAGLAMLTRISIKVRLAWSTVAQMGFMVMECGLGLYTLAALHLLGHSIYKAHAFLSASAVVREDRLRQMRGELPPAPASLWLAAPLAAAMVFAVDALLGGAGWPPAWLGVLALAWAPLLWWTQPASANDPGRLRQFLAGLVWIALLAACGALAHALPFGLQDRPDALAASLCLAALAVLYLVQACASRGPGAIARLRGWAYAGFHVDELYTALALRLWPTGWNPAHRPLPTRTAARWSREGI